MQINIYQQHTNRFIHELDCRRHPPVDLPHFSLYYSLFRSNPNINPSNLITLAPAQEFNQSRALRTRKTSSNTL